MFIWMLSGRWLTSEMEPFLVKMSTLSGKVSGIPWRKVQVDWDLEPWHSELLG